MPGGNGNAPGKVLTAINLLLSVKPWWRKIYENRDINVTDGKTYIAKDVGVNTHDAQLPIDELVGVLDVLSHRFVLGADPFVRENRTGSRKSRVSLATEIAAASAAKGSLDGLVATTAGRRNITKNIADNIDRTVFERYDSLSYPYVEFNDDAALPEKFGFPDGLTPEAYTGLIDKILDDAARKDMEKAFSDSKESQHDNEPANSDESQSEALNETEPTSISENGESAPDEPSGDPDESSCGNDEGGTDEDGERDLDHGAPNEPGTDDSSGSGGESEDKTGEASGKSQSGEPEASGPISTSSADENGPEVPSGDPGDASSESTGESCDLSDNEVSSDSQNATDAPHDDSDDRSEGTADTHGDSSGDGTSSDMQDARGTTVDTAHEETGAHGEGEEDNTAEIAAELMKELGESYESSDDSSEPEDQMGSPTKSEMQSAADTIERVQAGGVRVPEGLGRWANSKSSANPNNWGPLLRRALSSSLNGAVMAGQADMTYSKRNPNQDDTPGAAIMMGLVQYPPSALVLFDSSPTMDKYANTTATFFSDIVLGSVLSSGASCDVASADTEITWAGRGVTAMRKKDKAFLFEGKNMGTDLAPVMEGIVKGGLKWKSTVIGKPDVLIVFTDGKFEWPFQDKTRLPFGFPKIVVACTEPLSYFDKINYTLPRWVKEGKTFVHVPPVGGSTPL